MGYEKGLMKAWVKVFRIIPEFSIDKCFQDYS